MNYSKYLELVRRGEKSNVDFKIRCDAFVSTGTAAKAELAKDICAMANNGGVTSHIIIGVSDDRESFESVSNNKLTDDNLQSFCKTAILPPPKIKVTRERWSSSQPAHSGKDFVVIQIGPHARQAFRLAREFISYREKVCYRRNEVWIRRGATSDLATPEEIARLVKGKRPEQQSKPEPNVVYARVSKDKRFEAMWADFEACVRDIGGVLYQDRVILPLRKLRYVWHCILAEECTGKSESLDYSSYKWAYEHGFLWLVTGRTSKGAFGGTKLNFKEKWGRFTSYYWPHSFQPLFLPPKTRVTIPLNTADCPIVTCTLFNLVDTEALRESFLNMVRFLESDQEAWEEIRSAREGINGNLRRWLKQGWLIKTNRSYSRRPPRQELGKNEFFDSRSGQILRRERTDRLTSMAQTVLDLSAGRLP